MTLSDQCITCVHYRLNGECDAFPNGIPEPIILGEHDHRQPYPGDNGIRFEAMPGERHPAEESQ